MMRFPYIWNASSRNGSKIWKRIWICPRGSKYVHFCLVRVGWNDWHGDGQVPDVSESLNHDVIRTRVGVVLSDARVVPWYVTDWSGIKKLKLVGTFCTKNHETYNYVFSKSWSEGRPDFFKYIQRGVEYLVSSHNAVMLNAHSTLSHGISSLKKQSRQIV